MPQNKGVESAMRTKKKLPMKTRTAHISTFGSFRPHCPSDSEGYIEYHDSPRYSKATPAQLNEWGASRFKLIRNAVALERACRALEKWQKGN